MIPIEIDIERISQISKRKESENLRFRTFLKVKGNDNLDNLVHRLNKEIESQIDCTKCGNCCINLRPCLTKNEIEKLSKIDNVSRDFFIDNYTEQDKFENIKYLKNIPCKYLSDKKCSIYIDRPDDCKSYPHIHKPKINSRTLGVIENYGICPIVFNVFERLKIEFRFR
jgi:Fe-S-cluster containining protein